ncbi:MAG: hypothetical protein MI923_27015 [Phycisphaerales bacterium]|nr:hypothetical protein [Phycisphaerales bacterium]
MAAVTSWFASDVNKIQMILQISLCLMSLKPDKKKEARVSYQLDHPRLSRKVKWHQAKFFSSFQDMRRSLHKLKVFQDKPTGCTKNKKKMFFKQCHLSS